MTNHCKDCVHFHDTYSVLPWYQKMITLKSEFVYRCDIPEFGDCVTGEWIPCVTARINKCHGEPPKFVRKDVK